MEYLGKVGEIAESEKHHPDIRIYGYNHVLVELSTHKLGGITSNDIVLAVKIDSIPVSLSKRAAEVPPDTPRKGD